MSYMDDQEFEKLVVEALDDIPEEFQKKLENVEIVIEDEPTTEQRIQARISQHGLLLGLYQGVPQTKRAHYTMQLPDKITIFKNHILAVSGSEEHIREQVRSTVLHEIGHHFGLSDDELRKTKKG